MPSSKRIHKVTVRRIEDDSPVSDLEQRLGFTMRNGETLVQIISAPLNNAKQYGSDETMPEMADAACA